MKDRSNNLLHHEWNLYLRPMSHSISNGMQEYLTDSPQENEQTEYGTRWWHKMNDVGEPLVFVLPVLYQDDHHLVCRRYILVRTTSPTWDDTARTHDTQVNTFLFKWIFYVDEYLEIFSLFLYICNIFYLFNESFDFFFFFNICNIFYLFN